MAGSHEDHVRWVLSRARAFAVENKVDVIFSQDQRLADFVVMLLGQFAAQMMAEQKATRN